MNIEPEIVAFCWMQGESDALVLSCAEEYYEKEKAFVDIIRQRYSSSSIEGGMYFIDGGINEETGKLCLQKGIDMLVSASYIHKDITNNINILKKLA